ncbi:DASH complex subunit SPC19 [Aspergillus fijiensis CBS 313.89]|uniref:DASH complex subunit SPC19 n=1 Tax=Aspergillus fijiensis CBS 313.89 TaxID=1448319 RepID=A0A8G1RUV3_9EURO|nr:mitotic spindle biogenesis protein Spc19 [Aspergillus fijiensis CBS 313.89]RAK77181.1 mitotic spindle biogenesis protein Spc19 [Aspergillus fijiensis CBS 313.89]
MAEHLQLSVSSLQSSLQLLDSSISTLDAGVSDFPRLSKVLQTTRHFELLPEPTLREAQQSLLDEITPSIAHLLELATNHVEKLSRREQGLRAKCDLQQGRLYSNEERQQQKRQLANKPNPKPRAGAAAAAAAASKAAKAAELRRLIQKKERLQYAVERLELQGKQRERQLRKSMAFQ